MKDKKKPIWVCKECGSDDIVESISASVNDTLVVDGVFYQRNVHSHEQDIWCNECRCETEMIEKKEVKEHPADKDARLYHEEQDHKAMEKANDR